MATAGCDRITPTRITVLASKKVKLFCNVALLKAFLNFKISIEGLNLKWINRRLRIDALCVDFYFSVFYFFVLS